jgi:hypothetical protein
MKQKHKVLITTSDYRIVSNPLNRFCSALEKADGSDRAVAPERRESDRPRPPEARQAAEEVVSSFEAKTAAELLQKTQDQMARLKDERRQALALAEQKAAAIDAIESVLWRIEDLAKREASEAGK